MAKALQGNKVLSEARSPRNDLKVLGFAFCLFATGVPSLRHPLRGQPWRVWKLSLFS